MVKCKNCGEEMDVLATYCPYCGATNDWVGSDVTYNGNSKSVIKVPDVTYTEEQNKGVAFLSYIGILLIVPLLKSKDSQFVRFHANQGIVVQIFSLIGDCIMLGLYHLSNIFAEWYAETWETFYRGLSVACGVTTVVIFVICFICWVVPLSGAIKGEYRKAPVIGNIKILR